MSNIDSDYPWNDIEGNIQTVDINSFRYINGVLRNTEMIHLHLVSEYYRPYERGFIDLLNVHNTCLHCPNLGHFNSVGVRGESTIIKKKTMFQVALVI